MCITDKNDHNQYNESSIECLKYSGSAVDELLMIPDVPAEASLCDFYPQQESSLSSIPDHLYQKSDVATEMRVVLTQLLDFLARMHDRCVMPSAKSFSYFRKTVIGQFPGKRHCDLARS